MRKKKKPNYILWLFLLIAALAVGYLLSGLYLIPGLDIYNVQAHAENIFRHPFEDYYNAKTRDCMIIAILIWSAGFLYYWTGIKNYMAGEEFGTAKWANIKAFNKKFADFTKKGKGGL